MSVEKAIEHLNGAMDEIGRQHKETRYHSRAVQLARAADHIEQAKSILEKLHPEDGD